MLRTRATSLDHHFDEADNTFQGVAYIKVFDDAVSIKATCSFCTGLVEGVLRFKTGYLKKGPDAEERLNDARQQIIAKIRREHSCGARIHADKIDHEDFIKRFI